MAWSKVVNETRNSYKRIGTCVVTSLVITMICCAICALGISHGLIREERVGYCALTVLLISSIFTNITSTVGYKGNRFVRKMTISAIYCLELVLMTALFFGGEYSNVIVTVFVVFSGLFVSIFLSKERVKKKKALRSKNGHR